MITLERWEFFVVLFLVSTLNVCMMAGFSAYEKHQLREEMAIETAALEEQTEKVMRYETIISEMMQGQWEPHMGIQKEFVEDWYGTEIWAFKAVNRPPGSRVLNVGEIIDRRTN